MHEERQIPLHEGLEADTLGVPKEKREGHGAKAVSEGRVLYEVREWGRGPRPYGAL